jgi:hypothetical protein
MFVVYLVYLSVVSLAVAFISSFPNFLASCTIPAPVSPGSRSVLFMITRRRTVNPGMIYFGAPAAAAHYVQSNIQRTPIFALCFRGYGCNDNGTCKVRGDIRG